ncbi:MAG TPA: membrane protein insertase YidC [Verrucomicrobiales bacterium]|nr:membrane protein insertase YidC [Verrucomicrobiales bacterium]
MKMNRTEWLVVIVCAAALGWMFTRPAPPKEEGKKPDAAAETKAADPAKPADPSKPAEAPATPPPAPVEEKTVVITNETAEYTFTNIGGALQQVRILPSKYSGVTPQLLNDQRYQGPIGGLSAIPGDIEKLAYTKQAQTDKSITYTAESKGLKITKEWSLFPVPADAKAEDGFGYLWDLKVTVQNTAPEKAAGSYFLYAGLLGKLHDNDWIEPASTSYADGDALEFHPGDLERSTFLGLWERHPDRDFLTSELKEMSFGGVHNQYYCILIRPLNVKKDGKSSMWSSWRYIKRDDPGHHPVQAKGMEAAVSMEPFSLATNESFTWQGQVYTGPRSGSVLNRLDKQFDTEYRQVMHYGWFRLLSRLFLGTLNLFYSWIGSYGISVMMLTLLVRICIWPLHIKATRSMKRMGKLAPFMKEIREKHKDDPQRMNMEVMKLYRDYGINPLGGCLPLLFQFPIFLGYYNMMKSAVEMRGHSFLWVTDLSMPDTVAHLGGIPINPLPILMTISMYLQMKFAPQPGMDANPQMQMQMKIFKIMPFLFMWFCYNFASALALYWTVQNVISIGQTWLMGRQGDPPLQKKPPRPSFMERAMAAQQARQQQMANKGPRPPRTGGGAGSAFRDQQRKK